MSWTKSTTAALAVLIAAVVPLEAADRALLVGVEHYGDPAIPQAAGAAADARALAEVLTDNFAFPADGIRVLVNGEATESAITDGLENWLAAGTAPGDRAFFLFAGHGSRIADDNGDEADGLDETLVPFDANPVTGEREIRDDQIDAWVAQLSGRRALVLLDAGCRGRLAAQPAAAAERADSASVRYLPGPDQLALLEPGAAFTVEPEGESSDSFLDAPEQIGRLTGVVVLTAAKPGQLARAVDVDGAPRGALSFVFESIYREPQEPLTRGLFGKVGKKVTGTLGGAVKQTALGAIPGSGLEGELAKDIVGTVADEAENKAQSAIGGQRKDKRKGTGSSDLATGSPRLSQQTAPARLGGTSASALDTEGVEVESAAVGSTGRPPTAASEAVAPPRPAPPNAAPDPPAAAAAKVVTVGDLPVAIASGMTHLADTGLLPDGQDPWFEVLSEQPIDLEPIFGDWQQGPAVALKNPVSPVVVSLRTLDDRASYRAGESLAFEISTDRAGHLYLLAFSEGRIATCIFPNPGDRENRIEPGTFRLPGNTSYVFPVQEPFGTDVVVALVSPKRLELCDRMNYTWDEIYAQVDLRAVQDSLRRLSQRGVGVQPASGLPVELPASADWQAASVVVTTEPR